MPDSGTAPYNASGRPRDQHIDAAVLGAALEVMEEGGYSSLSLETVARRAGTSRPAIYRRWSGRAPLALDAIASRLDVPEPPNTGCTLCDIGESFNVFLAAYRTIRPDALSALYAECAADPALRERYWRAIAEPARQAVATTLDRAITRDDLRADADRELLLDMIASLVHYRALFGHEHMSDETAEQAIETLLRGAAVDYKALLAHSEEIERQHLDESGAHHVHLDTA